MKYYFQLQSKRLNRWLKSVGIHPLFALSVGVVLFILLSKFLFYKTDLANWIYPGLSLGIIFSLSEGKRNNFIKGIYSRSSYLTLRVIENSIMVLPFFIYLLYEGEYVSALTIIPLSIVMAFYTSRQIWNRAIPTPFKKFPFEFIVGFRKSFWFIAIAYFLIGKGIQVANFNLGLFGLFVIFICSMTYYAKAEDEYYVWIYNVDSKAFLKRKLFTSVICVSILSFIGLLMMLFGFPNDIWISIGVYGLGYIFLASMIVVKYSAFPHEMNVPQLIIYAISLIFPPVLLITGWIFYAQAKKRLEPILG